METQQLIRRLSSVINAETDTLSIWHNQLLDHINNPDNPVDTQQLTPVADDLSRIVDFCRLINARLDLLQAHQQQAFCADCPLISNPPCESSVPCCRCNEDCNSRQPCPKQSQPKQ